MQRCRRQQWWKNPTKPGGIFPCWEVAGEDTEFTISLDGKQYSASINAHSLLTLKVDQDGNLTKTNLIERELV